MKDDESIMPAETDHPTGSAFNTGSVGHSPSTFNILLAGSVILTISFLSGICLSFYQWDRGSPFDLSNWGSFNPIGRATYAPLLFALVLLPITLPLLLVVSGLIYLGLRVKRLWPLSILGFLSLGLSWLWYINELWNFD